MEDRWLREEDLANAPGSTCQPISLYISFNLFDLLLTACARDTSRGIPYTLQAPLLRVCAMLRACLWQLGLDPLG